MDKNNTKTVFKEYIQPTDMKVISKIIDQMQVDKYVKKLDSLTFIKLFIYAQLKQLSSLKEISFKVRHKKKLQKELGLKSISKSQLSRKLSDLPPEIFESILHHLVQQIHREFGKEKGNALLGKIHLIDSTTISFCLSQYRWAHFRNTKAGVKIHTRVVIHEGEISPDKIIITPARRADSTQLDALMVIEKDALHVFDRGYFDFDKFDDYCKNNVRFCTRIKDNTVIKVIEELPVDPSSDILREAVVKLGKMKYPLRLIETLDSQGNKISIIINDAKMSAEEISDLYRSRWQIELFFKWMKQHMVLKKCYGKSANAVYNQVYIAMITFCLTLLMKKKVRYQGTLLEMLEFIKEYWWRSFSVFLKELFKKPKRSSKGRRRLDHDRIFNETLAQFEDGDTQHLNDLSYDPIY
ncbi:IS4 family transposase [Halalkalibacterium halodurans]|uniref:IS4 family transposase n=1 Tax=Halalkalibacterium halodurans TaxID=86665 RepID=UPI001067AEC3|nr:IS4 family transposase [Halalkalibacterium halodurans]MED3648806.1 IS4 family transposase [Halalkalibacterium halodurans]TES47319.1 IS4 family transposase [Halalkalibacterium halodurans]TES50161.1 IS4 family transposase [Halalkalibacterium halodurans]TES52125.1 IS4 family transposase [Halalkalibacterium halodurans]TES54801.1 IS4 family transposase [Halalkalibacterium halodurans]